jgi:hypothetical protein
MYAFTISITCISFYNLFLIIVLLKDIKKTKSLKAYIKATEAKINKVDTHEVALFVEKFMLMEV